MREEPQLGTSWIIKLPYQGRSVHRHRTEAPDIFSLGQFADDSDESPVLIL